MSKLVRVLRIPGGEDRDYEGRQFAEDWVVTDFPKDGDGATVFLTTDHVHASEYSSVIPPTSAGLAVLFDRLVNERFAALGPRGWVEFVGECEQAADELRAKHAAVREAKAEAEGQQTLPIGMLRRSRK